mmetsp:Transcript_13284/g.28378  ORF Transcript_13284/g.28378 Transcript_13284/m.28378 type:complete len:81 (-) Transcript_13284:355-597(-)
MQSSSEAATEQNQTASIIVEPLSNTFDGRRPSPPRRGKVESQTVSAGIVLRAQSPFIMMCPGADWRQQASLLAVLVSPIM